MKNSGKSKQLDVGGFPCSYLVKQRAIGIQQCVKLGEFNVDFRIGVR